MGTKGDGGVEALGSGDGATRGLDDPAFDPFRRADGISNLVDRDVQMRVIFRFPLVVIRFICALSLITTCYVVFLIFGPSPGNMSSEDITKLPKWRQAILEQTGKNLARAVIFCSGFHYVKVTEMPGYDPQQASRCTIVGNHVSMVDILLMMSLFMPSFVAKIQVSKVPLVGRIACGMQCIFVDRLNPKRSNATEIVGVRQRETLEQGLPPLIIFPEGTTTNGKFILPFKKGAFVAGTPVLPVILRYPCETFSPAYESIKAIPYFLLLLSGWENRVECELHPVYTPSAEEKADAILYSSNVRNHLAELGRLQKSESTYLDKLDYHALLRPENQQIKSKAA